METRMTPLKNPLPADFREHLHKTVPEQMTRYSVGRHTIMRWRRMSGVSVHQRAWTDEMLNTLKTLVEDGYSYDAIAKQMNVGRKRVCNAVDRYRLSKGTPQTRRVPTKPVPEDFVQRWTDSPVSWLCKHYGVSTKTIRRWVISKGLKRVQKGANVRAVDFTRQPAEKQKQIPKPGCMTAPVDRGYKEDSAAGEAQRFLQDKGYIPVVRCDAERVAKPGGKFWICGLVKGALTDAQLVARATEIRERDQRLYGRAA